MYGLSSYKYRINAHVSTHKLWNRSRISTTYSSRVMGTRIFFSFNCFRYLCPYIVVRNVDQARKLGRGSSQQVEEFARASARFRSVPIPFIYISFFLLISRHSFVRHFRIAFLVLFFSHFDA